MFKSKSDEKPKPGDLIEIFRGLYEHWAVDIGDGWVVHLAPPSDVAGAGAKSVMSVAAQRAMVKGQTLSDVVGTDKWKVNKDLDEKYEPHTTDTIVKEALELVGTEQPYDIMTQNCEHFAKKLRYGKAESWQVSGPMFVFYIKETFLGLWWSLCEYEMN
ncbi:phospholipase A and acyltransferase 3-like [Pagrus major]|uniref:phospholipase A and acyltransferase 3-like n=1 Tax=Pagrus major TaxID=143350 RepID=UPI003CC871FC